jgi:colanic acid/amylovoran biosynthesis protein
LAKIFNKSLIIFVRDQKSLNNLIDIGVKNPNLFIAADAAFALADKESLKFQCRKRFRLSPNPEIAISVRDWKFFKSVDSETGREIYYEYIRTLVKHLIRQYNARVTFISTCQGIAEYGADDSRIAQKIVSELPAEIRKNVKLTYDFHSPLDLIDTIKGYELVVATRLHMAILSLAVGIPVFPIAYEFKTEELFKRLGLERWVQSIERLNKDKVKRSFDSFLESLPDIFEALCESIIREQKSSFESVYILKKHFDKTL